MPTTPVDPNTNQSPDSIRLPDGEGVENASVAAGDEPKQPAPQEVPFENDTPREIPSKATY